MKSIIGDYDIDQDELLLTVDAMIDEKGLISHHIDSCNELYSIGISQIVSHVFEINMSLYDIKRTTPEEQNIDHIDVLIKFSNVVIDKPTMLNYNSGKEEILFPNVALAKEKTYKSTLRVDVHIKLTAIMNNGSTMVREDTVPNFKICKMPILVKSKWCNTYNLSKEALTRLNEDPSDVGGYFIIKGIEWSLDCVENILFNKVRIFRNEGYKKEIMRAEFIAKPGDFYLNSDQFIVRWLNDGQITIEIKREKLKDLKIPFYLLFRAMGWNTDKQIFDNILFGYDNPTSKNMIQYIKNAFNAKYTDLGKGSNIYSQHDVLQYIAEEIKDESFSYLDLDNNPENYQKVTNFLLENIDIHLLQHMGSNAGSRDKKMRFLCVIIRKIFLVHLGNMEPTDRDSYNSKRIHASGTTYAKSFKTNFNASVIQHMRRKITKDLKVVSFSQIELASAVKSSVFGADFERSITQSITAGNKSQVTINNKARINRLSSQLLNRKNQLNVFSTLRQVTATSSDSSKQSERASEMRRVHMSFHGYICVIHSPEGEKVGINKQLALSSLITKASFGEVIKDILLSDSDIYPLDLTDYEMINDKQLCNVYVNGNWIGCCDDALQIAKKYRQLRREFKISPEITIVWDNTQDEVYFWTDVGRVLRPLLIVYNNKRDKSMFDPKGKGKAKAKKDDEFYQCLNITKNDIKELYSKELDFETLLQRNIVEFISAEEQENMFLCPDFNTLRENKNNELKEYTHCDIPQMMLGITALTSPYADHNQAQRIVYQTSQSKQTCGLFAKNWAYRADKDSFLQYNNEMPLVKTISNRYLHPNGTNCIVAIMCNTGYNVEDSIVMNKGAIDRGLFNGSKFTFYKSEIEQREEFANPDITNTTDIKSACYDKLENGIIKVGTLVEKGDAIIGKVMKITKNTDDNYQFVDRSVIYKESEPAIVHSVIVDRNEEDERFCKVVLRKRRPVENGDKFSSRSGQKSTVGLVLRDSDMPSTINGIRPSIILNPHAIPSRMTVGQLVESLVGGLCAEKCTQVDATIFKRIDLDSISNELEDLGLNKHGYHRLYNGITGEYIDCMIFMGPTYYQRLQKFTIDTSYSITNGPTDAITRQNVDGKSNGGGLRIGEMERDTLCSHGSSKFISEKYFDHSDGFTEYVCRCGKTAVFNKERNIYKCNYCQDDAEIIAYPTSWSSKLLMQEMESMNVGIKRLPGPFTYDDKDLTNIDKMFDDIDFARN
jgi:DNA-directed RNA polymerase beta subunit